VAVQGLWYKNAVIYCLDVETFMRAFSLLFTLPGTPMMHSFADASGSHDIDLSAYGHRWLRVGAADTAIDRTRP
jgi:hypothetical protein